MLPELCLKPEAVDFRHNPLTWPPVEVCNRGFEAMRNYIEPKWRELKEFKRRRIVANTLGKTRTNMTRVRNFSSIRLVDLSTLVDINFFWARLKINICMDRGRRVSKHSVSK